MSKDVTLEQVEDGVEEQPPDLSPAVDCLGPASQVSGNIRHRSIVAHLHQPVNDWVLHGDSNMNMVAWVLQIVLAVAFLLHGLLFTVAYGPVAKRAEARGRAPSSMSPAFRQFIGVAELAAAFGLTVPPAVHIFPWLAPLAPAGLVIVLVGAALFRARKREFTQAAVTGFLGGLAAVTGFFRWQGVARCG